MRFEVGGVLARLINEVRIGRRCKLWNRETQRSKIRHNIELCHQAFYLPTFWFAFKCLIGDFVAAKKNSEKLIESNDLIAHEWSSFNFMKSVVARANFNFYGELTASSKKVTLSHEYKDLLMEVGLEKVSRFFSFIFQNIHQLRFVTRTRFFLLNSQDVFDLTWPLESKFVSGKRERSKIRKERIRNDGARTMR